MFSRLRNKLSWITAFFLKLRNQFCPGQLLVLDRCSTQPLISCSCRRCYYCSCAGCDRVRRHHNWSGISKRKIKLKIRRLLWTRIPDVTPLQLYWVVSSIITFHSLKAGPRSNFVRTFNTTIYKNNAARTFCRPQDWWMRIVMTLSLHKV